MDSFRELLGLNPTERKQCLANRTPEHQKLILEKVGEYEKLNPNERELRLRITELRYYLLPLLETPATNRAAQLLLVPETVRPLLEARLSEWDRLPPEAKRELLENEATLRYFGEISGATPEEREQKLKTVSATSREKLERGISQWMALSEGERSSVMRRFQQFFELTPREQEVTLRSLSDSERAQIDRALKTYSALPPGQRAECIRALQKYLDLTAEERQQFLKNAEQWQTMPPDRRQAWRNLVAKLSSFPPLPPPLTPSLPPLPPANPAPVTNGN